MCRSAPVACSGRSRDPRRRRLDAGGRRASRRLLRRFRRPRDNAGPRGARRRRPPLGRQRHGYLGGGPSGATARRRRCCTTANQPQPSVSPAITSVSQWTSRSTRLAATATASPAPRPVRAARVHGGPVGGRGEAPQRRRGPRPSPSGRWGKMGRVSRRRDSRSGRTLSVSSFTASVKISSPPSRRR